MQYEVPLLRSLGFEVFVPKIIPKTDEFRSCAADFSFDESLTIPEHALRVLNSCHFYQRNWPPEAVFYMNRYFGTAFIMPMEGFRESVTNFEGNLLMRAFGLINTASYHKHLEGFYGEQVFVGLMPFELSDYQATFDQGIDFRKPGYPTFLKYETGISFLEEWGRWSDGRKVTLTLAEPLNGKFKLVLVGGAFGKNVGMPIPVRVGHMLKKLTFSGSPHPGEIQTVPSRALPLQNVTIVGSVLALYSYASSD